MKATDDPPLNFTMVFAEEGRAVLSKLQSRELNTVDFTVLMAGVLLTDHKTGEVKLTVTGLGEHIGQRQSNVSAALKRLRQQALMVTGYDSDGRRFMMVNPYLAGRRDDTKRFGIRWARFKELCNDD